MAIFLRDQPAGLRGCARDGGAGNDGRSVPSCIIIGAWVVGHQRILLSGWLSGPFLDH
jgi:hypothetical protein